jgi:type II secretory pathway component PulF
VRGGAEAVRGVGRERGRDAAGDGLLARWIDALRLGIDAGLDLPRAVALAGDATGSPRLADEGRQMADALVSGRPAAGGGLLPQTIPAAIELAGRAGDLQSTLATLTRMYQQQAEHRIRLVPVIVAPVALFLIAATVMTTIAALAAPLVKLIQAVSGGGLTWPTHLADGRAGGTGGSRPGV